MTPHSSPLTPHRKKGRRAVFLDRDGTINVEKDYLHKIEDFAFIPGAPEAIKRLKKAGFLVIVVSNQSGIGRGYFDEEAVELLHGQIQARLAAFQTAIDAFYYCPHHPEAAQAQYRIVCDCRKGAPGMLLQAAREHDIDLQQSFMVGDKEADLEAGDRAGCRSLLVLTGYGQSAAENLLESDVEICPDLTGAATVIVASVTES